MKKPKFLKHVISLTLVLLLVIPFAATSAADEEVSSKVFTTAELEQLLAPIALYPDALLAQVLTAATYPLEIVEADRFVKLNPGLRGIALIEAAKDKDWEPSVKAMLSFPDVLSMMDEQLEWTEKLGAAFLGQQGHCMAVVQDLRQKAYLLGNLNTSTQQVVKLEPQTKIIIIEPVSPTIVYVPAYDPFVVYGPWWRPGYPPYYFRYRTYIGVTFLPGFFVEAFWGTWFCNWHTHHVYVNVRHYHDFTRHYYHEGSHHYYLYQDNGHHEQAWRHDSRHAGGMQAGVVYPAGKAIGGAPHVNRINNSSIKGRVEPITPRSKYVAPRYIQGAVGKTAPSMKVAPSRTTVQVSTVRNVATQPAAAVSITKSTRVTPAVTTKQSIPVSVTKVSRHSTTVVKQNVTQNRQVTPVKYTTAQRTEVKPLKVNRIPSVANNSNVNKNNLTAASFVKALDNSLKQQDVLFR